MKKKWFFYVPVILYGVAWIWIMSASAHLNCDAHGITQSQGLCLGRSLAEGSCFAGYFGLWAYLGGLVAKSKGRNPVIGWILGFTLEFMGCLVMMTWEPRRDKFGTIIGWDKYKNLTLEERKAIQRNQKRGPR